MRFEYRNKFAWMQAFFNVKFGFIERVYITTDIHIGTTQSPGAI